MIVGDRSSFAIESSITQAFSSLGQRALGYFVIYVRGKSYGVKRPDASLLACSFEEVGSRIARRGVHQISYLSCTSASLIVEAFLDAKYRENARSDYFGNSLSSFISDFDRSNVQWAPDGDAAFDDGSYIMQFDVGDRVRLIAFINAECPVETANSIEEEWIDGDIFYRVLSEWEELFAEDWSDRIRKASVKSATH